MNRNGPENFITLFTGTDDLQLTDDYIIFRPADDDGKLLHFIIHSVID